MFWARIHPRMYYVLQASAKCFFRLSFFQVLLCPGGEVLQRQAGQQPLTGCASAATASACRQELQVLQELVSAPLLAGQHCKHCQAVSVLGPCTPLLLSGFKILSVQRHISKTCCVRLCHCSAVLVGAPILHTLLL
jgi:hypothetical protein